MNRKAVLLLGAALLGGMLWQLKGVSTSAEAAEASRGALEPQMVSIPAGDFMMGSPSSEQARFGRVDEQQHRVHVNAFEMAKYDVTFEEYDRFAETTGREKPSDQGWGRGNRPVINVSWYDATAYANWLSQQTGKHYRLPTEAEWEYAARAGTTTAYWWGDSIGRNNANCSRCGNQWDGKQTSPVGSFAPNPWGLYDMSGNVWQWTCSAYNGPYNSSEQICQDSGSARRVFRGGSRSNFPSVLRSAFRGFDSPDDSRSSDLGLRLVRIIN